MPGTEGEGHQHTVSVPTLDKRGRYQYVKTLGTGKVLLAKNVSTGKEVAIKVLNRTTSDLQEVETELLNYSSLCHPHVVQFREVFLTDQHINVVMDFANARSLFEYVQARTKLREPLARWFFQQLILAVDYCHRKGVAHRDICLEKILLMDVPGLPRPLVKLCGFGNSKHDNRSRSSRFQVGGLVYTAPEFVQGQRLLGKAADVWSCGVVLYTMLVGKYPFQGKGDLLQRMQDKDFDLPESPDLPPKCRELLQQMLQPDISSRISVSGIMSHPWFCKEMPPGAADMNDKYVARPRACEQTEADIVRIIEGAAFL